MDTKQPMDLSTYEPTINDSDVKGQVSIADDALVPENGAITSLNLDAKKERALVWKFDLRILPVLAIMYLFNSLDKGNLGM